MHRYLSGFGCVCGTHRMQLLAPNFDESSRAVLTSSLKPHRSMKLIANAAVGLTPLATVAASHRTPAVSLKYLRE